MATSKGKKPQRARRAAIVRNRQDASDSATTEAMEHSRRVEHQARVAEVKRADLLAVATHDLRNPLSVVLVTTSMLARELTAQHQLDHVVAIRRATMEMSQVLEDLMDGARIDEDQLELDEDECTPRELVNDAIAAARGIVGDRAIAIEPQVAPDLPQLVVDRQRILHVFSRVVTHALRSMSKTGTIAIDARRDGDDVRFSVSDSGPEIPESQRPYAFLRCPPHGRRACRGTGLGMFVVKGIVEAHGGRVQLTSDTDRGTTVSFTLPIRRVTNR